MVSGEETSAVRQACGVNETRVRFRSDDQRKLRVQFVQRELLCVGPVSGGLLPCDHTRRSLAVYSIRMADVDMAEAPRRKQKGRGFRDQERMEVDDPSIGAYDNPTGRSGKGPAESVEGWVIIATNIHEEADEDQLQDIFREYGEIKNMHLNVDRRTGYIKGYVLVEYALREEAETAIQGLQDHELLDKIIVVDWAFSKGPIPIGSRAPRRR